MAKQRGMTPSADDMWHAEQSMYVPRARSPVWQMRKRLKNRKWERRFYRSKALRFWSPTYGSPWRDPSACLHCPKDPKALCPIHGDGIPF